MVSAPAAHGVLERLLNPNDLSLSPEVAKFFLRVDFTGPELRRIAELSEKANEGDLSPEEHDELFVYVLLKDLLTILHSHARNAMKGQSSSS